MDISSVFLVKNITDLKKKGDKCPKMDRIGQAFNSSVAFSAMCHMLKNYRVRSHKIVLCEF